MSFPTPSRNVSNAAETTEAAETEAETEEETVYEALNDEITEKLQEYWMVVDTYRGISKLARSHLFETPEGVTNADITALQDRSPLASDFVFYKEAKDDLKAHFQDLRNDDEIPNEVGLRGFKEEMAPEFDSDELSRDNAEEFGVNPEAFYDDEDPILVPDEYEPETDEDGNLVVWTAEAGDEATDEEVISTIKDTSGVDSKAPDVLETLKEAGYKVVHN
jgi:hypothetical protein